MKNLRIIFFNLLSATALIGCGSGSSNSNSPTPDWNPPKAESGPVGPIAYQYIIDSYYVVNQNIKLNQKTTNKQLTANLASTCGLADNSTAVVTGALSFVPFLAPVMGPIAAISGVIGAGAGSSCTTQQLNTINQTLNYQENQIQSLQSEGFYFANQFASANLNNAIQIEAIANYSFDQSFTYFVGNNNGVRGLFANLMIDTDFWSNRGMPNTIRESAIGATQVLSINPEATAQEEFQQNIANVTGLGYSQSCMTNCYIHVNQNSNSALILTLNSLYNELSLELQAETDITSLATTNIVSDIDGYNSTVNGLFVQALGALQEAYAIEFMVNLFNFEYVNNTYFAQSKLPAPIGNVIQSNQYGSTSGTYFNYVDLYYANNSQYPTESQAILAYNKAQEQLSLMYAAGANQLYQTILSYTLSDNLIGPQQYPSQGTYSVKLQNGRIESYTYNIPYNLINSESGLQHPLNLLGLSGINIAGWGAGVTPELMAYQYSVNNAAQCIGGLASYNLNSTVPNFESYAQAVTNGQYQCAPVFGESFAATYIPGTQLSFFWSDGTLPIASLGAQWNNLANTPNQSTSSNYSIANYNLNIAVGNQNNSVFYLVNNQYNQPNSSAAGANNTWTQIASSSFINTEVLNNVSYTTNYIVFSPTVYNNTYNSNGSLSIYSLSTSTSHTTGGYDPGVLPSFSTQTTPNSLYFNPLGYDTDFFSCGSGNSVINYILPDGTPIQLDFYLYTPSCPTDQSNGLNANIVLYVNPSSYPTVSCTSSGICTTPNGNSYQMNLTTATNAIYLSAALVSF